ncbi:hypothetical protein RJ639_016052 [Escallonia herrerae]|uniref:Uncharacterized protein n=1 Tax=Escallonia herrerae TaxID=1293975 RepID=A0AA88VEE2_9ASTE|nr:hypothetical protein RJ639_016052 [Escallonia herrerae]
MGKSLKGDLKGGGRSQENFELGGKEVVFDVHIIKRSLPNQVENPPKTFSGKFCTSSAVSLLLKPSLEFFPHSSLCAPPETSPPSLGRNASAASAAAALIALALLVTGTGRRHTESAKFKQACWPLSANAATSWARAAISAVGYVPSHILDFLFGSRSSHTHLLEFLRLTPLYTGCRVSLNFFLPARLFGRSDANITSSSEYDVPERLLHCELDPKGFGSEHGLDVSIDESDADACWIVKLIGPGLYESTNDEGIIKESRIGLKPNICKV